MSFTVAISPRSGNGNRSYTVTVTSDGTFAGVVNLSCELDPSASCSLDSTSLDIPAGGSQSTTVNVGNVIAPNTLLTVTGTHDAEQHSDSIPITAGSFHIDVAPVVGSDLLGNKDYRVTVTSDRGFAGDVSLDFWLDPDNGNAAGDCDPAQAVVNISAGGSAQTTVFVRNVVRPGTSLKVLGTYHQGGHTVNHDASLPIAAGYFEIDSVAPADGGNAFGNKDYRATVTSYRNFAGDVSLDFWLDPDNGNAGGDCDPAQAVVNVSAGGSAQTTVLVRNVVRPGTSLKVLGTYHQGGHTVNHDASLPIAAGYFEIDSVAPADGGNAFGNKDYRATVTSYRNFAGDVSLDFWLDPDNGNAGGDCDPAQAVVNVSAGGSAQTTVLVRNVVRPGTSLKVLGTYHQGGHTVNHDASLPIEAGYFETTMVPSAGTDNMDYRVTVTPARNFHGTVTVDCWIDASGTVTPSQVQLVLQGSAGQWFDCHVGTIDQDGTLTAETSFVQGGFSIAHAATAQVSTQ
jgi:hypothetical protein